MTINQQDLIHIDSGPGGSVRRIRPDGTFYSSTTTQGNGADTTDDVLFIGVIPASMMDKPGAEVTVTALGDFGATANNKQIKCWIGPTAQTLGAAINSSGMTAIAASGVVTVNNGGWELNANIIKAGALGANTQKAQGQVVAGSAHTGTGKTSQLTLTETAQQFVVVTGASGTTGAANDCVGQAIQLSLQGGIDPPLTQAL